MAWTWEPAIYKGGTLFELPKPVKSLVVKHGWHFETTKVPLADGQFTDGHSKQGVSIFVQGELGSEVGVGNLTTAQLQFERLEAWTTRLDVVSAGTDKYEFVIWNDKSSVYRKYKDVSCVDLTFDIGDDKHVIHPYTINLFAEDPTIYTTAPGS
jgi:hypothetical protein